MHKNLDVDLTLQTYGPATTSIATLLKWLNFMEKFEHTTRTLTRTHTHTFVDKEIDIGRSKVSGGKVVYLTHVNIVFLSLYFIALTVCFDVSLIFCCFKYLQSFTESELICIMRKQFWTWSVSGRDGFLRIFTLALTLKDRAPIRTLSDRGGGLKSPPLYLGNYYR